MSSQITPPVPESSPRDRALFRVNPMSHLESGILLLAVLGPISVRPAWFLWLLLLPLGFSWWVLRTRTRVDDDGVTLHSWRDSQTVSWDRVSGVMFPRRGFARLVTTDDTELSMGGVSFHDLPRLHQASAGRIPDPYRASEADLG